MTDLNYTDSNTTPNKLLIVEKSQLLQNNIITDNTKTIQCYRKSK